MAPLRTGRRRPDSSCLHSRIMRKRRSGESGLAMGLASITSSQSESRFASQANHFRFRQLGKCPKVTKRYHAPLAPYQRALAHAKVTAAVKRRLRGSVSLAPSGRAHGRVSHKPRGTWQLRRSSCRTGARPATRLRELSAGNRSDVRQDPRQDGDGRRGACHAPTPPSAF